MEKIFYEAVRSIVLDNPGVAFALFFLFNLFKFKSDELTGWLKRLEREHKEETKEIREFTRDGLKEERQYKHDVMQRMDERINEHQKDIGEIKGILRSKRR